MKCQLRSKNKQINESMDGWIHVVNCFDMDGTLLLSIVSIHIQHEQPRVQCSTFWNEWELCSLYIWFTDWWNPTQCIEMNHSSNIYLQFHSKTKGKKKQFGIFVYSSHQVCGQSISSFNFSLCSHMNMNSSYKLTRLVYSYLVFDLNQHQFHKCIWMRLRVFVCIDTR